MAYVKTRAGVLLQEVRNVRQMQQEMRADHYSNVDTMMKRLHTVEADVLLQVEKQAERHVQSRTFLQNSVHHLDEKLSNEKNVRVHKVSQWKKKHASLTAEKDDIMESLTRQINQCTSQVHSMDRIVQSEEAQGNARRETLEQNSKKRTDEKNNLERTLDNVNRELFRLETQTSQLEGEERIKEQQLKELYVELRQTQDSLHAQQNANEHLRLQYEEQRERLLANNDKDLDRAKQMGDEKLKRMKDSYDQDEVVGRKQLAALEEQVQTREADLEHKKRNCDAISAENAALERDVQMWKNMFESTNKQRQEQERDLAHLRQEWTRQKHTTQEMIDSTEAKRLNAENDLKIMSNQFVEYKRQCTVRGTALTSRINAMEEALNTTKTQIEESKLQLSEITDQLSTVTSDGLVENNKAAETIHKLEREFDQQNLDWQEEKKHLDSALDAERRKTNEQRDRLEKWKETHQQQLRQLQEEGNMRLQNVEREKNRTVYVEWFLA